MENVFKLDVTIIFSTVLILSTLAETNIPDHYSADNGVTDYKYTSTEVQILGCWYGYYFDDEYNRLESTICVGSCETREYPEGIWYNCAHEFMEDGCIVESTTKTCYCNQQFCNTRQQEKDTLLPFKTNLINLTTEVQTDDNKSNSNAGADVAEPIPLVYVDVIGHNPKIGGAKDDQLMCWYGFWGQGRQRREEKECKGSCVTRVYIFGIIFGCGERMISEECRKYQGAVSCFCNRPLCNNGTIPGIFM